MAQAPIAITYFGSAIWSYSLFNTGPILLTMVPAMMITSACRGVARATSNPNLDQSYLAAAVDIISMAQQLVPKTSGQSEFDLAQLITSSMELTRMPPPGYYVPDRGNWSLLLSLQALTGF
jgi:hypothetical protein